ncbi:hypothetical protein B0H66DRAFT_644424 [Apodospora peruviana]|uniref:Uncharacterized protein n=1 Tax=Apodospora peruviana TaxID=516989 RepID=A0AAE0LY32_9PEZI|nr:hypothetical protein B0H66DRAFT_644424 [Apodospora peruviana]
MSLSKMLLRKRIKDLGPDIKTCDIPYMYSPRLKNKTPIIQQHSSSSEEQLKLSIEANINELENEDDAKSALSEEVDDFIIPGPLTNFAYEECVQIIQDLRAQLSALDAKLESDERHFTEWNDNQMTLIDWHVRLTHSHFVACKSKWERLRFKFSDRKKFADELYRHDRRVKIDEVEAQKEALCAKAGRRLGELGEVAQIAKQRRRRRSWLEKMRDPDHKRKKKLLRGIAHQPVEPFPGPRTPESPNKHIIRQPVMVTREHALAVVVESMTLFGLVTAVTEFIISLRIGLGAAANPKAVGRPLLLQSLTDGVALFYYRADDVGHL